MSLHIVHGVLDNDPKGTTGKGTIFYVDVTVNGVTERIEWGLLDQVQKKFNLDEALKPYRLSQTKG